MSTIVKRKVSGWLILLLITPIYFYANLQKVIIPGAAFDELQQVFSLDAAGVTRLGALFLGIYAAAQLIIGVLVDRYGGARVIICGGLFFCIGSLVSAFESSLYMLYFARIITGAGAASIYLSMVKEIGRVSGSMLPTVLGVATIIGYSGSITGASPFIAGVDKFGYFPMVMAAGIGVLISYLIYTTVALKDDFPTVKRDVKFSLPAYLKVFSKRQNCCLMISVGISFGTYFALQSTVGKKFLEDFCGLSGRSAGIVLTVTMIIAAVNGLVVADISRWCGNRRHPVILFSGFGCLTGAALVFTGVLLPGGWVWLPVTGMILMAFAGNVSPIFVASLKESNEENCFGTVVCVCNGFAYAVSAIFSGGAGRLMDIYAPQIVDGVRVYSRDSYLLVWGMLVVLGGISAVLSLFHQETSGRNIPDKIR